MTSPYSPVPSPAAAQIVAGAVAAANVIYLVVAVLLKLYALPEGGFADLPADIASWLGPLLLVVGATASFSSIPFRRLVEPQVLARDSGPSGRLRVVMMSMAVAEAGGVVALVYVMLSGRFGIPLVLWGCALSATIYHFPSRAWLEAGAPREELDEQF